LVHIDGNQPVENVAQQIQSAVKGIQWSP
jgi:hypothetical protein